MIISYENLDLIPQLLQKIEKLENDFNSFVNSSSKIDLTILKNVSKFLSVSKPTIYNMIQDGRFKQNIHYKKLFYKNSVKIVFVESAILKYKKEKL